MTFHYWHVQFMKVGCIGFMEFLIGYIYNSYRSTQLISLNISYFLITTKIMIGYWLNILLFFYPIEQINCLNIYLYTLSKQEMFIK